jgi:hypothetical protein
MRTRREDAGLCSSAGVCYRSAAFEIFDLTDRRVSGLQITAANCSFTFHSSSEFLLLRTCLTICPEVPVLIRSIVLHFERELFYRCCFELIRGASV